MTVYSRFGFLAAIIGGMAHAAPTPANTSATVNSSKAAETPDSSGPSKPTSGSSTASVSAPSSGNVFGVLEVRPTLNTDSKGIETEDTIEAGYAFNAKTKLSYAQFLKTNLFPSAGTAKGVNLRGDGGFLRMKVNDIWQSANKQTSLSYQGRFYTPTDVGQEGRGFIGIVYNAIRLNHTIGPVKLGLAEIPMFHIYSKAGFLSKGAPKANGGYRNRVEFTVDVDIVKNLSLSVPLILDMDRRQTFAGAANSNKWEATLWAWPEINYTIDNVHTVGIGYRIESSMVSADFSKFTLGDALKESYLQAIWTVSL